MQKSQKHMLIKECLSNSTDLKYSIICHGALKYCVSFFEKFLKFFSVFKLFFVSSEFNCRNKIVRTFICTSVSVIELIDLHLRLKMHQEHALSFFLVSTDYILHFLGPKSNFAMRRFFIIQFTQNQ